MITTDGIRKEVKWGRKTTDIRGSRLLGGMAPEHREAQPFLVLLLLLFAADFLPMQ